MTDIQIPEEAIEAAKQAWCKAVDGYGTLNDFITAACLAMLKAWPRADLETRSNYTATNRTSAPFVVSTYLALNLPLPQKETKE
jgi:hypothetical protein